MHFARSVSRRFLAIFSTEGYRSGHNEAVLKTVCPKGTGVRIPLPAPKNKDTPPGCPLFFATVRGDELSFATRNGEFAYRRHGAYLEEQTLRGICVARRCLSQVTLCGTLSTILTPSSIPLFLLERILTPLCDSPSRRMGFAFERKPSG